MRRIGRGAWGLAAGACAALLALSACEKGGSTAARSHPEDGGSASAGRDDDRGYAASRSEGSREAGRGSYASDRGGYGGGGSGGYRRERADTPLFHGEPLWSDNRQHTAQENADYHCKKSGPDIGATGLDDCLTKVHAFIDHPPAGVETLTRANGDKLLYDPQANLFAVARKDGAPRTFFKPTNGQAYWAQQKTREAEGGSGSGRRGRGSGSGDEGAGA